MPPQRKADTDAEFIIRQGRAQAISLPERVVEKITHEPRAAGCITPTSRRQRKNAAAAFALPSLHPHLSPAKGMGIFGCICLILALHLLALVMKQTLLLTLLLLIHAISPSPVRAADQHADNYNFWWNYVGDHPLFNSPWGLHLEVQNRREDWGDEWQQLLIRPGINYT